MSEQSRAFATLLRALICLCALAACRASEARTEVPSGQQAGARDAGSNLVELSPEGMNNAGVRTERAQPRPLQSRVLTTGTIEADPRNVAVVGSRAPGRIASVPVRIGDSVRRGQALVTVDTTELHQIGLEYLTAVARARQTADELERYRALAGEGIAATMDVHRAEAEAAIAAARMREGEEHLHLLGLTESQIRMMRLHGHHGDATSTVRTPIDGRVVKLDATVGRVLVGTEDLATVLRPDDLWAIFRVYERDLAYVTAGGHVTIRVPSYPDRVFDGTTRFVGALVSPETRTFEARAAVANDAGLLRPGMSATVSFERPAGEVRIWLPVEAVQRVRGAEVVFVRIADRRFEMRRVTVGPEQDAQVPVIDGVAAGDEVVVHGAFALRGEIERVAVTGS